MKYYFEIIRWKNLIFVAIIQWLMQHAVAYPILQVYGFETDNFDIYFILLILATVFITAGGYIINDYFDVKIDKINKPEKVIVGKSISIPITILYYQILTICGTIVGIILAILVNSFSLGFIFIVTPGLLWFYSASYKRQFLIGNLIVSLTSALSIIIVGILTVALLAKIYSSQLLNQTPVPSQVYAWIGGFSGFAFLLTWIREIIKDLEDIEGDKELECRTMPIKWGTTRSKFVVLTLILITIVSLYFIGLKIIDFEGSFTLKYISFGLVLPLVFLSFTLFKSKNKEDFHQTSNFSKIIMLLGVLYSLVFYFLMSKTYGISMFGLFLAR